MAVTVKVICDSISPEGIRLTTLQLRYPRMVHADFMTHRVFSRNGRSSRAVPFATLVKEAPYLPNFAKNQKGMVAGEELGIFEKRQADAIWIEAAEFCQKAASKLNDLGVHKQWVNRMLEWFGYIDVLVTSTDWSNFFALRQDGGAQPEIIELANAMKVAIDDSKPKPLLPGQWHRPYIDLGEEHINKPMNSSESDWGLYFKIRDMGEAKFPLWAIKHKEKSQNKEFQLYCADILNRISVARCARLTIKPFDGNASIEAELKRYDLLMTSRPVHASPAEHIATPDHLIDDDGHTYWLKPEEHGNFYGWRQFRKMIPHNTIYDR